MCDIGQRKELVRGLLSQVINGNLTPEVALEQWPDIDSESDPVIKKTWQSLYDYMTDEDICEKESDYRLSRLTYLRGLINELRDDSLGNR